MPSGEKTKELWKDPAYRKNMRDAHLEQVPYIVGKKHTPQAIEKIKIARAKQVGDNHPKWVGNDVKYQGLHGWIHRQWGKANKCDNTNCHYPRKNAKGVLMEKPYRYEWANINGKYTRDRKNWKMLCVSCHRLFDNCNKDQQVI